MKTIKLPETDYSGMRQFYQEELDKTLKRLQHIQSVLAQLGDNSVNIDLANLATSTTASASIAGTDKPTPKRKYRKKAGRKAMWGPVILKRMQQINRPLTYDELTDEIMQFSKLSPEKRLSTKQAIVNVTFRLRSRDNKIDTFSNGSREKYLGLKKWFDEEGIIKDEFRNKLPKASSKPTAKKGKVVTRKAEQNTAPATSTPVADTQVTAKRKPGRPVGSKGKKKTVASSTPAKATPATPAKKGKRGRPVGSKGKAKTPAATTKPAESKATTAKSSTTKAKTTTKKAPKRVTKPVVRKVAVKAAPTTKAAAKKKAVKKRTPKK